MKWANLRLDECTMARLSTYRRNLESAIARQPGKYPPDLVGKRLSLGDAIGVLLNGRDTHRKRVKLNRHNQTCTCHEVYDSLEDATPEVPA